MMTQVYRNGDALTAPSFKALDWDEIPEDGWPTS